MAKFKFMPTVNVDGYFTAKLVGNVTDVDVGKPVRLTTTSPDTYQICADGEAIDAFIVGIEPATADGLHLATLNNRGYVRCEADGAMTIGGLVEAAANAAAGTANAGGLPYVSAKAVVGADLTTTASGTQISVAVNLLLAELALATPQWRVVSSAAADGTVLDEDTTVIIERVL
jgi:hypothetical protein